MIGNDIIDRAQARQESNWQRKGFLGKLFTSYEQDIICTATDPEQMVWALWSMKESAYKVRFRETGKRSFAPQKLACQITSMQSGRVEGTVFYEQRYQTTTLITQDYIATVAFSERILPGYRQIIIPLDSRIYQHQSATVRQHITAYCSGTLSIPADMIGIDKDYNGIPLVIHQSSKKAITSLLSISHHGYYGAFAISFPETQHD